MAGMVTRVQDPLLRQVIQSVEKTLAPDMQQNYQATVVAGMKLIWSAQFDAERERFLSLIKGPQDVPKIVSKGIVKVISLIQNELKTSEPIPTAVPAAITLMAQVLEYLEKKLRINIQTNIVDITTHLIKEGIFALFNITPEVLQSLANRKGGQAPPQGQPPDAAQPAAQPAAQEAA